MAHTLAIPPPFFGRACLDHSFPYLVGCMECGGWVVVLGSRGIQIAPLGLLALLGFVAVEPAGGQALHSLSSDSTFPFHPLPLHLLMPCFLLGLKLVVAFYLGQLGRGVGAALRLRGGGRRPSLGVFAASLFACTVRLSISFVIVPNSLFSVAPKA